MDGQKGAPTPAVGTSAGVTVRFWAAARAATAVESAFVAAGGLAGVLEVVAAKYPDLSALLPRCSLLLDGVAVARDEVMSTLVPVGATVEILPPFAGG